MIRKSASPSQILFHLPLFRVPDIWHFSTRLESPAQLDPGTRRASWFRDCQDICCRLAIFRQAQQGNRSLTSWFWQRRSSREFYKSPGAPCLSDPIQSIFPSRPVILPVDPRCWLGPGKQINDSTGSSPYFYDSFVSILSSTSLSRVPISGEHRGRSTILSLSVNYHHMPVNSGFDESQVPCAYRCPCLGPDFSLTHRYFKGSSSPSTLVLLEITSKGALPPVARCMHPRRLATILLGPCPSPQSSFHKPSSLTRCSAKANWRRL